jgi:hypothetical protein
MNEKQLFVASNRPNESLDLLRVSKQYMVLMLQTNPTKITLYIVFPARV